MSNVPSSLSDLFHNPTVAGLASLAEGRRAAPLPEIKPRAGEAPPGPPAEMTAEELQVLVDDDD